MMNRFAVAALVACLLVLGAGRGSALVPSPTQVRPAPAPRAMNRIATDLRSDLQTHRRLLRGIESLQVSPDGRSLASLRGTLSEPLTGDLEPAVRAFLIDHADLINLPAHRSTGAMALERAATGESASHFFYHLTCDGLPVWDSTIGIHVGIDRRIQLITGSFPRLGPIDNACVLTPAAAIDAACTLLHARRHRMPPQARAVIFPAPTAARHAFQVSIGCEEPLGDWEIFIDAETGRELACLNQMVFVDGRGAAYPSHPLAGNPVTITLPHLTTDSLCGRFANVWNEDALVATSANYEHFYAPDNTHFDEVNVYYYMNRVHDFFKTLGFSKLDRPFKAVVHKGTKYDNAYYSPREDLIAFGDGDKLNPLSREESVCWHEYAHAVFGEIITLYYFGESGAINEGQADYFACSLADDPKMGEYVVNKQGKPYLRHLENDLHYPEDIKDEVHEDGKIWGATLWDIREALGPATADRLIFASHAFLKPGKSSFLDGFNALLTADRNLNGSANRETLFAVFRSRGIVGGAYDTTIGADQLGRMVRFDQLHQD